MKPDESELHDAKLTALYREDAQQMPSSASDAAILAAARRAVGAGPQRRSLLLRQRWLTPLLAAATVAVIAIGIVRMIPPEEIASPGAERFRAPAPASAPTPATAPATAPAAEPAPDTAASAPAKAAAREDHPARLKQRQVAREAGDSSAFVPAPPAAPAPPRSIATAPEATAERAPVPRYEAPAAAPSAATPPPPAPATAQSAPSAPAAAGAMLPRKSVGAAPMPSQDAAIARDPVKWINAIRELRIAGRRDDAARELAEFKRRYPDYELPADLRDEK